MMNLKEKNGKDLWIWLLNVDNENEAYKKRMIEKFEFLKINWEEMIEKSEKLPTNVKETLKENGHSFIGYCLAKRFQFVFNDEGQAKTKFYKDNNSYLLKYATEINGILGPRRVDLEYYKKLENKFKKNINSKKTYKEIDLILNDYWGIYVLLTEIMFNLKKQMNGHYKQSIQYTMTISILLI
uniref:Uncharacterized protein n=1 Tax=Meloidogyne enterolobii TaxID=390850 RepID=A0A6V7X004_MELEN|nr:unnamed protein product [Meloidogyne enterolobii]